MTEEHNTDIFHHLHQSFSWSFFFFIRISHTHPESQRPCARKQGPTKLGGTKLPGQRNFLCSEIFSSVYRGSQSPSAWLCGSHTSQHERKKGKGRQGRKGWQRRTPREIADTPSHSAWDGKEKTEISQVWFKTVLSALMCISDFFHCVKLLAPDIRHERNVLLQCVRYVVRNNFFGLESKAQNQAGMRDKPEAATPTGEHEERQKEKDSAVPQDGNQEDLETSKAIVVDQNCLEQGLQSDQVCSEASAAVRAEQAVGDFIQNAEETAAKDCHSQDSTATDKITCESNIYDDEIWESPGAVM